MLSDNVLPFDRLQDFTMSNSLKHLGAKSECGTMIITKCRSLTKKKVLILRPKVAAAIAILGQADDAHSAKTQCLSQKLF
jgi:hypothetical protein